MEYYFANGVAATLFFILGLFLLGVALAVLINDDRDFSSARPWFALVSLCFMAALFGGWWWSSHHFAGKPNQSYLLIEQRTGQSTTYTGAGIYQKEWTQSKYEFPGATSQQWCPELTPSVSGGAEVSTTICFTYSAQAVNWSQQYMAFNARDEASVYSSWLAYGIRSHVATAISAYPMMDLTNKRVEVEDAIYNSTKPIFEQMGVPLESVSMPNWTPSSQQTRLAFEQAQLSAALVQVAENQQNAARINAETSRISQASCQNAGFTSEQTCLDFLMLQWLSSGQNLPANLVLSVGSNLPLSYPVPTQPVPQPNTNP